MSQSASCKNNILLVKQDKHKKKCKGKLYVEVPGGCCTSLATLSFGPSASNLYSCGGCTGITASLQQMVGTALGSAIAAGVSGPFCAPAIVEGCKGEYCDNFEVAIGKSENLNVVIGANAISGVPGATIGMTSVSLCGNTGRVVIPTYIPVEELPTTVPIPDFCLEQSPGEIVSCCSGMTGVVEFSGDNCLDIQGSAEFIYNVSGLVGNQPFSTNVFTCSPFEVKNETCGGTCITNTELDLYGLTVSPVFSSQEQLNRINPRVIQQNPSLPSNIIDPIVNLVGLSSLTLNSFSFDFDLGAQLLKNPITGMSAIVCFDQCACCQLTILTNQSVSKIKRAVVALGPKLYCNPLVEEAKCGPKGTKSKISVCKQLPTGTFNVALLINCQSFCLGTVTISQSGLKPVLPN